MCLRFLGNLNVGWWTWYRCRENPTAFFYRMKSPASVHVDSMFYPHDVNNGILLYELVDDPVGPRRAE